MANNELINTNCLNEKYNRYFYSNCQYDEKDSIGKRYRRHDAIGTPFCVTVDHQTAEDNTVTIRYRDTMAQKRVAIEN